MEQRLPPEKSVVHILYRLATLAKQSSLHPARGTGSWFYEFIVIAHQWRCGGMPTMSQDS